MCEAKGWMFSLSYDTEHAVASAKARAGNEWLVLFQMKQVLEAPLWKYAHLSKRMEPCRKVRTMW